jgi:hypothetical protein
MPRDEHGWPAAWLLLALGCGGAEPPPRAAGREAAPAPADGARRPRANVESEIGALDEAAVTRTFGECVDAFQRCLDDGARRVELLGGSVGFRVKIGAGGRVLHAYLESSTLGDRATERCLLDAVRGRRWPEPVGGQAGIARKGFDFDAPDVRPPEPWEADRVAGTLRGLSRGIDACTGGARGFTATLYVGTDGKALGVGMAPPDEAGEGAVDCLVRVLGDARWPSPGSWPAKVTFSL